LEPREYCTVIHAERAIAKEGHEKPLEKISKKMAKTKKGGELPAAREEEGWKR